MEQGSKTVSADHPSWVHFLASAMRLIDLHDSQMQPGSRVLVPPPEERRGQSQGLYVSIAWRLLEELRDQEISGKFDFIDITPFARQAAVEYGVSEEDVKQIALILATPTQFDYLDAATRQPRGARRITPLIDKQRRGYRCRLTRKGREALQFSAGYMHWVHAGVESRKLRIDLEMRNFRSFLNVARRIWLQIRDQAAEIIKVLEQPEADALRQDFITHHDRYLQTLEEIGAVIGECQMLLRRPEMAAAIAAWMEEDEEGVDVDHFLFLTREISAAAMSLQRRFSRLIIEVHDRARPLIQSVRFEEMAAEFCRRPPSLLSDEDTLARMFDRLGPVGLDLEHFSPLDLHQVVEAPREKPSPVSMVKKATGITEKKLPALESFIAANRPILFGLLEKGPLRLSDFLAGAGEYGEMDMTGLDKIIDGIGIFTAPLTLGIADMPGKMVSVRPLPVRVWDLPDGWRVSGNDMEIRLIDRPSKEQRRGGD
ncbi:hypothetical protein [Telmatospirillum sp. J64-1]|uniref:hypothetical protein n=1 Tax=Telmatospirillum sp. J64-1 TaxID=2502183 RepID=UPI00115CD2A3|nr:hypothetical protein [Telmatospirillum sp. J64-1]